MIRRENIANNVDWTVVFIYLTLVFMGWINIYAAVYNEEHKSILDFSQRYGSQLLWIIAAFFIILILFMVDGSQKLTGEDIDLFWTISHKPVIIVINKTDVIHDDRNEEYGIFPGRSFVRVSAKQQTGIDALKKLIFGMVTAGTGQWQEDACAPNIRHKDALIRADSACERVKDGLRQGLTNDLLAVDLQECLNQLDEIVGTTTTEDILDAIFTKFCIGK